MHFGLTRTLPLIILSAAAVPAVAQDVLIENFIGRIDVVTDSRVTVEGARDGTVERRGSRFTIDGGESLRKMNCSQTDGRMIIKEKWDDATERPLEDYPLLRISLPSDGTITIRDSVLTGEVESAGLADVDIQSCGRLRFGSLDEADFTTSGASDIQIGRLGRGELRSSGSGRYIVERSGPITFKSRGSGSLVADTVEGDLSVTRTGSGAVRIGRLDGDLEARSTGSSRLVIETGDIPTAVVSATGSGGAEILADVGDLRAHTTGSGDIRVRRVKGTVTMRATGSGNVTVDSSS